MPTTDKPISSAPIEPIGLLNRELAPAASGTGDPDSRRKRIRKKKRRSQSARDSRSWRLVAAGIAVGALVAVSLLVGLVVWIWPRGEDESDAVAEFRARRPKEVLNEFTPVPWSVPSGATEANPVLPEQIVIPASGSVELLPGRRGEYLTARTFVKLVDGVHKPIDELVFGRVDLATGKLAGEPKRLGSEFLGAMLTRTGLPPAAIAPDGSLAVLDARANQIRIWGPNWEERTPIKLTGPADQARFDWSAGGHLLVLDKGKLAAWDPAAGKSAFEVGDTLQPPLVVPPARNWLAVSVADKYLEILDAASGVCRGRFGGEGKWWDLIVTPDARRLVGQRSSGPYDGPFGTKVMLNEIHDWDLATGEHRGSVPFGLDPRWPLLPAGSDHVLYADRLYDVKHHVFAAQLRMPGINAGLLGAGVDGRFWCIMDADKDRTGIPQRLLYTTPVPTPREGEVVFHPGVQVKVEAACGDAHCNKLVSAVMSEILREAGYPVGPSEWTIRVSGEVVDGGHQLEDRTNIPAVRGEVQLIAPGGTVVQSAGHSASFPEVSSKYYAKREVRGAGIMHRYDFGGKNPRTAMAEEAWEWFIRGLDLAPGLRGARKSGDKYLPLPQPVTISSPRIGKEP